MSDLPPGWEWTTLGDVATISSGIQKQPKRAPAESKYPFLRVANVLAGELCLDDVHEIELFHGELSRLRLERGDLLVVEGNGSPSQIGRAATWRGEINDCVHQNHLIRVRPHSMDSAFLETLWNSPRLRTQIEEVAASTSGLYTLSARKIASLRLPFPPLAEQHRIVGLLDEHLGSITRGEGLVGRCRERGVAMWEKSIVGVLHVHGRPEPSAPPPSPSFTADGDLPALPDSWSWKRLQDVADVAGGLTKDSSKQSDPDMPLVPYLRVANVQRGRLDLSNVAEIRATPRQVDKLRLLPGDVLLNEGGDRDKLGRGWVWDGQIADCIHQNHVFRARVRNGALHPKLLAWHANSFGHWFERNGKQSVNLASISLTTIKQLPVPVPPRDVQDQLVAMVEGQLAAAARLDSQLGDAATRSRRLRSAVLSEAFAGRLVPQDPDDEPASVLLDRIRSERAADVSTGGRRRRS